MPNPESYAQNKADTEYWMQETWYGACGMEDLVQCLPLWNGEKTSPQGTFTQADWTVVMDHGSDWIEQRIADNHDLYEGDVDIIPPDMLDHIMTEVFGEDWDE